MLGEALLSQWRFQISRKYRQCHLSFMILHMLTRTSQITRNDGSSVSLQGKKKQNQIAFMGIIC